MKEYDYGHVLTLLAQAQEDWHSQCRVSRRTYVGLRRSMPERMGNRMESQLTDYQSPYSTRKAIVSLTDLPAWKEAERWASAGLFKQSQEYSAKTPFDAEEIYEASKTLASFNRKRNDYGLPPLTEGDLK